MKFKYKSKSIIFKFRINLGKSSSLKFILLNIILLSL